MKKLYRYQEPSGITYIDCSECNRGGNGLDKDKCACGWKTKRPNKGGCFLGALLPHLSLTTLPTKD